jgi:hypothetical protein
MSVSSWNDSTELSSPVELYVLDLAYHLLDEVVRSQSIDPEGEGLI